MVRISTREWQNHEALGWFVEQFVTYKVLQIQ